GRARRTARRPGRERFRLRGGDRGLYAFCRLKVLRYRGGQGFPIDFIIDTSTDGVVWTTVVSRAGYPPPTATVQTFVFTTRDARYLRVAGTNLRNTNPNDHTYRMQLAEIEAY